MSGAAAHPLADEIGLTVNQSHPDLTLQSEFGNPDAPTVRVTLAGSVDLATADQLRTGLLSLLEQAPTSSLGLDMSKVDFCDCVGLQALVAVHEAASRSGRGVHITAAGAGTEWLLGITGVGARFDYPPSPVESDEALAGPGVGIQRPSTISRQGVAYGRGTISAQTGIEPPSLRQRPNVRTQSEPGS